MVFDGSFYCSVEAGQHIFHLQDMQGVCGSPAVERDRDGGPSLVAPGVYGDTWRWPPGACGRPEALMYCATGSARPGAEAIDRSGDRKAVHHGVDTHRGGRAMLRASCSRTSVAAR